MVDDFVTYKNFTFPLHWKTLKNKLNSSRGVTSSYLRFADERISTISKISFEKVQTSYCTGFIFNLQNTMQQT